MTFEGDADESPDHAAGDVILRVKSKKVIGGFERKESNLYWKETLSIAEALLGFRKSVKGLDGHDIILSRTGTTQPGFAQTIKGEGLPIYHESGNGDMFITYNIVLPDSLTPKTSKALTQLLNYKIATLPHPEL